MVVTARIANPLQIIGLIDQFTIAQNHTVQQGHVRVGVDDFLQFLQQYMVRHPAVILKASANELTGMFNSLAGLFRETHALEVEPTIRKIAAVAAARVDDTVRANMEGALATLALTGVSGAARAGITRIERSGWEAVRHTEGYSSPVLTKI